jgi:protein SCO1/2
LSTKTAGYIRQNTMVEKAVSNWMVWVLFIAFVFSVPIFRSVYRELPDELPRIFQITNFKMKTQYDEVFSLKRLGSRYSIVHFHDFGCNGCIDTLNQVKVIQKRVRGLGSNVAILSVNVNPEFATAEKLEPISRGLNANPYVWKMLYKENSDELKTYVNDVFQAPLNVTAKGILYPEKIYLVDKEGHVRGLYGFDKESVNRLMIDVGLLINSAFKKKQ